MKIPALILLAAATARADWFLGMRGCASTDNIIVATSIQNYVGNCNLQTAWLTTQWNTEYYITTCGSFPQWRTDNGRQWMFFAGSEDGSGGGLSSFSYTSQSMCESASRDLAEAVRDATARSQFDAFYQANNYEVMRVSNVQIGSCFSPGAGCAAIDDTSTIQFTGFRGSVALSQQAGAAVADICTPGPADITARISGVETPNSCPAENRGEGVFPGDDEDEVPIGIIIAIVAAALVGVVGVGIGIGCYCRGLNAPTPPPPPAQPTSSVAAVPQPVVQMVSAPVQPQVVVPVEQGIPAGPKFCPHCGTPLQPGAKFCPTTGKPIQAV